VKKNQDFSITPKEAEITFFSECCPYFSSSFVIKNENTIHPIFTNMNGQK
jgi:hypothetical protein